MEQYKQREMIDELQDIVSITPIPSTVLGQTHVQAMVLVLPSKSGCEAKEIVKGGMLSEYYTPTRVFLSKSGMG